MHFLSDPFHWTFPLTFVSEGNNTLQTIRTKVIKIILEECKATSHRHNKILERKALCHCHNIILERKATCHDTQETCSYEDLPNVQRQGDVPNRPLMTLYGQGMDPFLLRLSEYS